jgi:hypothetical protein
MNTFDAISETIRANLGAKLLDVLDELEQWRKIRSDFPKEEAWQRILSDVISLEFEWKDSDINVWKEDKFSPSLHAYSYNTFKGSDEGEAEWKAVTDRARTETNIGGMFRLWEYLLILRSSDPDFTTNPFIQMLKYYLDTVWGREEGFFQHTDGDIMQIRFNAMDSVRIHLLTIMGCMSTAWKWKDMKVGNFDMLAVMLDVGKFMFNDPYYAADFLKSLVGFRGNFGTRSTSGKKIYWDSPDLAEYTLKELEGDGDVQYSVALPLIQEELAKMKEKGLTYFRKWYVYLLDAPVNDVTATMLTWAGFIEGSIGFQRSLKSAVVKAASDKPQRLFDIRKPDEAKTKLLETYPEFEDMIERFFKIEEVDIWHPSKPAKMHDIIIPTLQQWLQQGGSEEEWQEKYDEGAIIAENNDFVMHDKIKGFIYAASGTGKTTKSLKDVDMVVVRNKIGETNEEAMKRVSSDHPGKKLFHETELGLKGNPTEDDLFGSFIDIDWLYAIGDASSSPHLRAKKITNDGMNEYLKQLRSKSMISGDWELINKIQYDIASDAIKKLPDKHYVLLTHSNDFAIRSGLDGKVPAFRVIPPADTIKSMWEARGDTIRKDIAAVNLSHLNSLKQYPVIDSWDKVDMNLFEIEKDNKGDDSDDEYQEPTGDGEWRKTPIVSVPMGDFIKKTVIETFSAIMEKGARGSANKLPSFDDHKKGIFKSLTSRSSGYKVEIKGTLQGRPVSINATDKTMNYLADPDIYFNKEMVMREMTISHPGNIFFRDVPARKTRVVLGVPMATYFVEALIAPQILNYQGRQPYFSLFKDAGRVLADHSFMIYASSRGDILGEGRDFSSFDQTENYENVRRFVISGMMAALRDNGESFGDWKDVTEALKAIWSKTSRAIFKGGGVVVELNMVLSGEFMTILMNNITNRSFQLSLRYAENECANPEIQGFLRKTKVIEAEDKIMGDDASEHRRVYGKLTPGEWKAHLKFLEFWASFNHMIIKAEKTEMSLIELTYLKKWAWYGFNITRVMQKQQISSERVKLKDDPIAAMHDLGAEFSESVARGWDHDFMVSWQTFTMALLTNYRFVDEYATDQKNQTSRNAPTNERFSHEKFPITAFFAPRDIGGAGLLPWTPVGSNTNVAWLHLFDEVWRYETLYSGSLVEDVFSGQVKEFADSVIETGVLDKGLKAIDQSLNQGRRKDSAAAREWLRTKGVVVGSAAYDQTPGRLVRRTIQDHEKVRSFALTRRNLAGNRLAKRRKEYEVFVRKPNVYKATMRNEDVDWFRLNQPIEHIAFIRNEIFIKYKKVTEIIGRTGRDIVVMFTDDMNFQTRDYILSAIRSKPEHDVLPDNIRKRLKWSKVFRVVKHHKVPKVIPENFYLPIAGSMYWGRFKELAYYTGISASPETFSVQTSRVMSDLMRDPYFPKDWTEEAILSILSSSQLSSHEEKVMFLRAMGASQQLAARVVAHLASLATAVTFKKHASYSVADAILSYLNLSKSTIDRIVGDISVPDDNLRRIGEVIGIMVYMLSPDWDPSDGISVQVGPDLDSVMSELYMWSPDVLHYERINDVGWH